MSTISCPPIIGLANDAVSQGEQNANLIAAHMAPMHGKPMLGGIQGYFSALAADIRRSRELARSGFPSVRGN